MGFFDIVKEKATELFSGAGEKVSELTGTELPQSADSLTDTANDLGDTATGAAQDLGDSATGVAQDVGDTATGAIPDVTDPRER